MKLKKTIGLFIFSGMIFFVLVNQASTDDTGDPYSAKLSNNRGAWTDETWEASGFYKTQDIPGQNSVKYSFTANPASSANSTYSIAPTYVNGNIVPGASLRSDLVVTEWKVTGHVHFTATAGGT